MVITKSRVGLCVITIVLEYSTDFLSPVYAGVQIYLEGFGLFSNIYGYRSSPRCIICICAIVAPTFVNTLS